jgi:tetratricopeptide (TPR) repeat protein
MRQELGDRAGEAATWHNLATIDIHEDNYDAARDKIARSLAIKQVIGDRPGEAATLHQLASIDLREGDYAAAREKFSRSLQINQAIGDRAGEAATLHNLASIDLNERDYAAAWEKFAKALKINQAIGDRAGEAATFFQIGFLATKMGFGDIGVRLVAICWLIDRDIGHGDADSDFRALSGVYRRLGYDEAQFDAMLNEAAGVYRADRGRTLIEKAFADDLHHSDEEPSGPQR